MEIQEFAEKYRLKTQRDCCGDTIIVGRFGNIFDGYISGLGVYVEYATAKKWNFARRAMEAAGFTIRQDAESEGVAVFDPSNKAQVRIALKMARVKTRRQASPAQLAALAAARQNSPLFASGAV